MHTRAINLTQLFTRLALSASLLSAVADRFGIWGPPGAPNVSWGDWGHFVQYSSMLTPYAGPGLAQIQAATATVAELVFAVFLLLGLKTKWTAIGTGLLMLVFGLSMTFFTGVKGPLNYGVWSTAGAAFLLSCVSDYKWSFDAVLDRPRAARRTL